MRLALFSLLLLTGCASGNFGAGSENSGTAPVRLGAQDETHCRHMTIGQGEGAYQQCVQNALEGRQQDAMAAKAAREAKEAREANEAKEGKEGKPEQTERAEGFGDRLQSAIAVLFGR
jgi:major membrane immunogen (membrane-anchored lipoprotein)